MMWDTCFLTLAYQVRMRREEDDSGNDDLASQRALGFLHLALHPVSDRSMCSSFRRHRL